MSLVPFTSSSPVVPPSSPAAVRAGLPSARAATMPGVSRTPALPKGDAPPATPGKGKTGFASVLAAAQDQDDAAPALPVESRPTGTSPAGQGEPSGDVPVAAEAQGVVAPIPADVPPSAQAQTPWLLLALGSGSRSWQDAGDPARTDSWADVTVESASIPASVESSDPVDLPLTLTGAPVVAPIQVAAPPSATTELAASAPAPSPATPALAPSPAEPSKSTGTTVVMPTRAATLSAPDAGTAEFTAVVAPEGATMPEPAGVPDSLGESPVAADDELSRGNLTAPRVTESSPGPWKVLPADEPSRDVRPATGDNARPLSPPTMEMLARWRAARRAATGVSASTVPPVAEARPDAPTGARTAPSPASSGLAQWMGQQAPVEGTFVAETSTGIATGAGEVTAAAMPASRASEVLFRLSQAGGDRSTGADHQPPVGLASMVVAPPGLSLETTPSSVPAAAPPLSPAAGEQVMQQVVQSLKMQWKDGIGEARLQLRPDALGAVSVTLRVEGGAVTAVVRAESAQVQEWVLQHQHTLRQQMEAAGLRLDELVVSPDDQRQQPRQQQDSGREQRPRPRAAADADAASHPERQRFEQLL